MTVMFDDRVRPHLAHDCEHMAALLKSVDDLPPLLTSFYQLGATRNGWLVHGSLPGEAPADRERLRRAGLDVDRLETTGQLSVLELDLELTPEDWVRPWSELLDERLGGGFDALWFARFPIGPTDDEVSDVLPFEEAWTRCFAGRRVFTLCPYIVGGLAKHVRTATVDRVGTVHDRVIDMEVAAPA